MYSICLSYGDLHTTIIICTPHRYDDEAFYLSAYSYVKDAVSPETKEPPEAVLSRSHARPYGLSAPKKLVFFRFVDT